MFNLYSIILLRGLLSCSHRTHILLLFMIMYSDQNNSYYNHPNSFQSIYLFLHLMNGTEGKQQLIFTAWFSFFHSTRIGLQSNSLAKPSTIHDAGPIKVKLPHASLSLLVTLIRSRSPSARRVPPGWSKLPPPRSPAAAQAPPPADSSPGMLAGTSRRGRPRQTAHHVPFLLVAGGPAAGCPPWQEAKLPIRPSQNSGHRTSVRLSPPSVRTHRFFISFISSWCHPLMPSPQATITIPQPHKLIPTVTIRRYNWRRQKDITMDACYNDGCSAAQVITMDAPLHRL
jgi:hypothetical protein